MYLPPFTLYHSHQRRILHTTIESSLATVHRDGLLYILFRAA